MDTGVTESCFRKIDLKALIREKSQRLKLVVVTIGIEIKKWDARKLRPQIHGI